MNACERDFEGQIWRNRTHGPPSEELPVGSEAFRAARLSLPGALLQQPARGVSARAGADPGAVLPRGAES